MNELKKIKDSVVETSHELSDMFSDLGANPGYKFFRDSRKLAQKLIVSLREYRKAASATFKSLNKK